MHSLYKKNLAGLVSLLILCSCIHDGLALHIVLAGGTGPLGRILASRLNKNDHDVTILTRNAFLASTPARVTESFGWVGESFLRRHPYVRLRDWDGGDLLDIVGKDWLGWQEDVLMSSDVVVHLVGGFTQARVNACERIVRESVRVNPKTLQITVNPNKDYLELLSPGMLPLKQTRIENCEEMVKSNCCNFKCLRLEPSEPELVASSIVDAIDDWADLTKS